MNAQRGTSAAAAVLPPFDAQFESWIAPMAREAFATQYWQQRPLHVRGTPERLTSLRSLLFDFDLESLIASAGKGQANTVRAWFVRDGQTDFRLSVQPGQARILHNAGFTLYFHPDSERLQAFHDEIAKAVSYAGSLNVSIFWSRAGQATTRHVDLHENFTVQLVGRKRWTVMPPGGDEDGGIVFDLAPGDVLYCPGECPHAVRTEEDSLSLNLCFVYRTWADLIAQHVHGLLLTTPEGRLSPLSVVSGGAAASARQHAILDALSTTLTRRMGEIDSAMFSGDHDRQPVATGVPRRHPLALKA